MACGDAAEAAQVSRQLSQVNRGCLITYRRAEDLYFNSPSGKVALIILAGSDRPEALTATLRWMRHRWPHCPIAVIGDTGGGDMELAARKGGASYLARPVTPEQWAALVMHVLHVTGPIVSEERLG
jgi:DNA-binding NtrC family response regulator